ALQLLAKVAIRGDFDEVRRLVSQPQVSRRIVVRRHGGSYGSPTGSPASGWPCLPFRAKWQVNESGLTPLMEAAKSGCWRCAKHLLHLLRQAKFVRVSRGGRGGGRDGSRGRVDLLKMQDGSGQTAQDLATDSGHFELARIIESRQSGQLRLARSRRLDTGDARLQVGRLSKRGLLQRLANLATCPVQTSGASAVCTGPPEPGLRRLAWLSCWIAGAPVNAVDEDNRTPDAARDDCTNVGGSDVGS
uniref:ANK_REP_REGION domain-containing protein n=1 Tax=Macrostomum lignano TaxID=282301 RepID=A0A1I8FJJ8_9PLAT